MRRRQGGGAASAMTSMESPAVDRRGLRPQLRRLRDERDLTLAEIADALEWSLSKVVRIERGDVTISTADLKALLALRHPGLRAGRASSRRGPSVAAAWRGRTTLAGLDHADHAAAPVPKSGDGVQVLPTQARAGIFQTPRRRGRGHELPEQRSFRGRPIGLPGGAGPPVRGCSPARIRHNTS
jgi:hypothetical protein